MDIITGYVGSPHVTAEQDRDINIGIFGNESYVLQTGSQLTAEVSSNNEIKVRDGVIMHQGCAASIKKNTYDSLTIANGSQGMKRVDLIVARYSRNPSTNVESLKLKVLQGTPSENSPTVPGYTTGDIQSGDLVADMPLYQVILNGLNITEVKKLFSVQGSIAELKSNLSKLSGCGQRCEYGKYGTRWQLTNNYGNIGSTLPAVDNELFKTVSGSNACAYVKKSGMYLLNFNGNYEGESVIWMQLAIDQATEYEYTVSCTRYTSLNFSRVVHLNAGQKITVNVSGSSGYTAFSTGKELMQVMCLSLD